MIPPATTASDSAARFQEQGFFIAGTLVPADLIARTNAALDELLAENDGANRWVMNLNSNLAKPVIQECASHPAVGQWAAAVTGASMVQVWAVLVSVKPPGLSELNSVNWHVDREYWNHWQPGTEEGSFVATIALDNYDCEESGPVKFVEGSHRWGLSLHGTHQNFLGNGPGDLDRTKSGIAIPAGETWREVPALLAPGQVCFHHCGVLHGSAPNRSDRPRRSLAVSLRTAQAIPAGENTNYDGTPLDDPIKCPVIYRR